MEENGAQDVCYSVVQVVCYAVVQVGISLTEADIGELILELFEHRSHWLAQEISRAIFNQRVGYEDLRDKETLFEKHVLF